MLITRLWRNQPGRYFCVSTKSATGKWHDEFFTKRELDKVPAYIERHADKDIYFCPHGFDRAQRLKQYAVPPMMLWSDLDEADPRKIAVRPTIALESSPGRYVGLWLTDVAIEEAMNRRLVYHVGADRSGWDLTQVLRMPGTRNHKYASAPRVRILWSDGPTYRVRDLEQKLPPDSASMSSEDEESDAAEVFKRHEKQLPRWVRRELIGGKPKPGDDRSSMIWKLENTMLERGLTSHDVFVLIKASPWNKFRGRRNEDEQLRRELDKGVNRHFADKAEKNPVQSDEDDGPDEGPRFLVRPLAEVEERNHEWLWYGRLALGEVSVLEGDPGLGKSYLAQMIAGHVVDGRKLPTTKQTRTVHGPVAYFDIENSADTVTKKRMTGNGVKNLHLFYQEETPFSIDDEDALDEVYEAIERLRPVMVVFDTLNTYIGKADTHNSAQTQQAFAHFRDISMRFNCCVLVLRHLTKSNKGPAIYRGQGSIAITGLARFVMSMGSHPEDPDVRVVALTKRNFTRDLPAATFTIKELPDTLKEQDRSIFEWGDFVEMSADELLAVPDKKEKNTDRKDAREFLEQVLDDGPLDQAKIKNMAESRSMPWKAVEDAADELGVLREPRGFGKKKRWLWSLADGEA